MTTTNSMGEFYNLQKLLNQDLKTWQNFVSEILARQEKVKR